MRRAFTRSAFSVVDATGRPVGVLVHDSRGLHAGACRLCGGAPSVDPDTGEIVTGTVYDQRSWSLTARWLARHVAVHGVAGLRVSARGRSSLRLVAAVNAVFAACKSEVAA